MAFDENTFDTDIITAIGNVGNTTTTNTANVGVDLDNVGNTDDSVNDSGNLDLGIDGSFQEGSHNESWNVVDSGNEGSYNFELDLSDHSENDNSVNAGVREYNTGFGDLGLGDAAGATGAAGAGEVWVNNHNTVVDQSVNGNILGGDVAQFTANSVQVASGEGSISIGGNYTSSQSLDQSLTVTNSGTGDILLDGSSKSVDVAIDSNNTTTVDVEVVDNSQEWTLDNVGNDYSATLEIDGSFNEETTEVSYEDWDIDANVIWDSNVAAIADNVEVDIDL